MKKKDMRKLIIMILIIGVLLQAGMIAFSMTETNEEKYQSFLSEYDVHIKFQNEIERLKSKNHQIADIMIVYSFLCDQYGLMNSIEKMIIEKETGISWDIVFKDYKNNNTEFVPRAFDYDYLQELMDVPGLTSDDIMISDRVSLKTELNFETIIEKKIKGCSWKEINAELNILNSQEKFPHVPITVEDINKYSSKGLTENEIVISLVTAFKLSLSGDEVIKKIVDGYTNEQIIAEYFIKKYN